MHRADRHEVVNFRHLFAGCGLPVAMAMTHAPAIAAGRWRTLHLGEPDIIALHLWATGQRSWLREWPEDRWIELAGRLARPETLFLVTGAPSDNPRSAPFVARCRQPGCVAIVC